MGSTPCVQLKCGWTNTSDCFTCTEETSWYDYLKLFKGKRAFWCGWQMER